MEEAILIMSGAAGVLAVLAPLLSALIIVLGAARRARFASCISIVAATASLSCALVLTMGWPGQTAVLSVPWLLPDRPELGLGVRIDGLSVPMLVVVTLVAWLVQVYSLGYMHGDAAQGRYFGFMSLFLGSMAGLVLAPNFIQLLVCWELVGLCSYGLIGHWFERAPAADAARKAFVTNRVGDAGFVLGILMLWSAAGTLEFTAMQERVLSGALQGVLPVAGLLLVCGAVAKSAQLPLHVWLPDAMEGPTPVSALIHAATMVAAGVYMLCRVWFLLSAQVLDVIAWTGLVTALAAASMAAQCTDIKRVLAYSTISQLGLMFLAVGVFAPASAMFHLTTHAFFKALLFLAAGIVILVANHEQDIRRLGGLYRRMPGTYVLFLIGVLALSGLPPTSGFFSKEQILAVVAERGPGLMLGAVLVLTWLSGFYMVRLLMLVFHGNGNVAVHEPVKAIHQWMFWPAVGLAVLAVVGGILRVDAAYAKHFGMADSFEHGAPPAVLGPVLHLSGVGAVGLLAAVLGCATAAVLYRHGWPDPVALRLGSFAQWLGRGLYIDELYRATVGRAYDALAALARTVDAWVIRGAIPELLRGTTDLAGRLMRGFQTGDVRAYAAWMALGMGLIVWLVLLRN